MVQVLASALANADLSADLKSALAPTLQAIVKAYSLDLAAFTPEQSQIVHQALQH